MCISWKKRAEDSKGPDVICRHILQGFIEALYIMQTYFGKTQELFRAGNTLQGFSSYLPELDGLLLKNAAKPKPDSLITGCFILHWSHPNLLHSREKRFIILWSLLFFELRIDVTYFNKLGNHVN